MPEKDFLGKLVTRIKTGDEKAFAELVKRYEAEIGRFLYQRCGHYHTTKDLMQESFLKFWKNRRTIQYQGEKKLKSFLYKIAKHCWIDYLRKHGKIREEQIPADMRDIEAMTPEEQNSRIEEIEKVRKAIGQLPAEQQAVINLNYYAELSYEEIARRLHCPLETVKSRLRLAKNRLKELLK